MKKMPPLLLAGPTASGKSEVALLVAEQLRGEIVSVDSMQVYRGLDIGTAKASPADRGRIPHHLLNVAALTETFDAAQFVKLARQAVDEIQGRGGVPLLCGGTGLYFKAFLHGLGATPAINFSLRAELAAVPLEELLQELARKDPATYNIIDRQNPRRVIRALEVIRMSGRPYSEQRVTWPSGSAVEAHIESKSETAIFGIARSQPDLRMRIDARVDEMFRRGLVEETRKLMSEGLEQNITAMQALGYRQVVQHLRGELGLPETIALVKVRTRRFAKRQMTWFSRQLPMVWLKAERDSPAVQIAESVQAAYVRAAGSIRG